MFDNLNFIMNTNRPNKILNYNEMMNSCSKTVSSFRRNDNKKFNFNNEIKIYKIYETHDTCEDSLLSPINITDLRLKFDLLKLNIERMYNKTERKAANKESIALSDRTNYKNYDNLENKKYVGKIKHFNRQFPQTTKENKDIIFNSQQSPYNQSKVKSDSINNNMIIKDCDNCKDNKSLHNKASMSYDIEELVDKLVDYKQHQEFNGSSKIKSSEKLAEDDSNYLDKLTENENNLSVFDNHLKNKQSFSFHMPEENSKRNSTIMNDSKMTAVRLNQTDHNAKFNDVKIARHFKQISLSSKELMKMLELSDLQIRKLELQAKNDDQRPSLKNNVENSIDKLNIITNSNSVNCTSTDKYNMSVLLNNEQYSKTNIHVNISNFDFEDIFNEEEDKEIFKNIAKQRLCYLIEQTEKEEKEGNNKSYNSKEDSKSKVTSAKKGEKGLCKKFTNNPLKFFTETPSELLLQSLNMSFSNNDSTKNKFKMSEEHSSQKNKENVSKEVSNLKMNIINLKGKVKS